MTNIFDRPLPDDTDELPECPECGCGIEDGVHYLTSKMYFETDMNEILKAHGIDLKIKVE